MLLWRHFIISLLGIWGIRATVEKIDDGYIGCYQYLKGTVFNYTTLWRNSGTACKNHCFSKYKYAGTEFERCYCGNRLVGNKVEDTKCTATCPSPYWDGYKCGAPYRLTMYDITDMKTPETTPSSIPLPVSSTAAQYNTNSPNVTGIRSISNPTDYMGCYRSYNYVQKRTYSPTNNSRINCKAYCKQQSYRYAGTHNGKNCMCMNILRTHIASTSDEECNKPCPMYNDETCGGTWHVQVYDTWPCRNEAWCNGSECEDIDGINYRCKCEPGWAGKHCTEILTNGLIIGSVVTASMVLINGILLAIKCWHRRSTN